MSLSCSAVRSATAFRTGPARRTAKPFVDASRKTACKAYVEPSVTYAVTQQAVAYAIVLGGDVWAERNSTTAPDLRIAGAGAGATLVAAGIINTGVDALLGVGLVVGALTSAAMLAYHVKRTVDANDQNVDWPGPKALPATISLISFFALNVFIQGIRAEL